MTSTLDRRQFIALLGAGAASAAAPAATASSASSAQDGAWTDAARGRALPWRLRLPAAPGPWPLLLYSHGLGGSRDGGEVWGRAWADAGFAVLHLQHPGSDTDTLRGGLASLRAAGSAQQLIARAADLSFMLDETERRARADEAPWRDMQPGVVGVAGHSFGAHTTLAVAGQRYPAPGSLADARPRAFVALSPSSPAASRISLLQSFGGIVRPMLAITGSLDGDPFGSYDGGEPRAAVFEGLPAGRRALLWLDGADHMTFGGVRPGSVRDFGPFRRKGMARSLEPAHHAMVARITTLWWRAQLLGDETARAALVAPEGLAAGDRWRIG